MEGKRESLWQRDVFMSEYPVWSGVDYVDVVVIGGGLVGILTAYFLREAGKRVILLEADRIAGGQTGRTTAKITSQHGAFYGKYQKRLGEERMRQYAAANEQAIRDYREMVHSHGIDCDWQEVRSFLYVSQGDGNASREPLEQEYQGALATGISASLLEEGEVPGIAGAALCFPEQACFHPLKFLLSLLPGLEIYEHSRVTDVEEHRVVLDTGSVEAEHIVFACHYPFLYRPGYYFLRLHQERSYVIAGRSKRPITDLYYPLGENGLSIRPWKDYVLFGGSGHRTGERADSNSYDSLRQMIHQFDSTFQETCYWSAQDVFSMDELPCIGEYSENRPYWHVATGFRKWGMTHAMIAARLIKERILGAVEDGRSQNMDAAAELFTPSRFILSASAANLAEEGLQVAAGLAKSLVHPPRCTHLGCSLVWNEAEGSWDCPCHGSRFCGSRGLVLDGPASRSAKGIPL